MFDKFIEKYGVRITHITYVAACILIVQLNIIIPAWFFLSVVLK